MTRKAPAITLQLGPTYRRRVTCEGFKVRLDREKWDGTTLDEKERERESKWNVQLWPRLRLVCI